MLSPKLWWPSLKHHLSHTESVRLRLLLEIGLVKEVESFYNRNDLTPDLPSMRLVGYRQIWKYLDNQITYMEMQERSIIATRQLAKRQMTWCRTEKNAEWHNPYKSGVFQEILNNLK